MSKRKKKKKNRFRHITYVDLSSSKVDAMQINEIANDVFGSLFYQIIESNEDKSDSPEIQQNNQ